MDKMEFIEKYTLNRALAGEAYGREAARQAIIAWYELQTETDVTPKGLTK